VTAKRQLLPFPAIHDIHATMDSMNISLPSTLKAYVDDHVAEGHYATASEYVRELIRNDAKAKAQEKLEGLLLEGLHGEATPWIDNDSERLLHRAATGN
jgi:antitoxin ParD1/3/4